jgi:hypothetical protein
MISLGNALTAVVLLNGMGAGTRKRAIKKDSMEIMMKYFRDLDNDEQEAIESDVARYGRFFGVNDGES